MQPPCTIFATSCGSIIIIRLKVKNKTGMEQAAYGRPLSKTKLTITLLSDHARAGCETWSPLVEGRGGQGPRKKVPQQRGKYIP